ncbi:hypothetical protein [Amycolatopsis sp. YIM 10]|uniref:hypothetical protein n=1 Tax=Amycolatopsis sp. YIM 10 TaxID=2653857 RepID=UPI00129058F1|nr:hypothetical protein [Amycolatopsis sp. YIM 10]
MLGQLVAPALVALGERGRIVGSWNVRRHGVMMAQLVSHAAHVTGFGALAGQP